MSKHKPFQITQQIPKYILKCIIFPLGADNILFLKINILFRVTISSIITNMKMAFERRELLNYIWKKIREELPPTHNINKKKYKTMSSYWKYLNFLNEYTKINRIRELQKIFEKYITSFGEYLKEKKKVEKITIFQIVNREKFKKIENYDDIKDQFLWSKKVNRIMKLSLDKVFLGAETIYIIEFKNSQKRNEYLEREGFFYKKIR